MHASFSDNLNLVVDPACSVLLSANIQYQDLEYTQLVYVVLGAAAQARPPGPQGLLASL
jgi:hypothetical protein